MTTLVVPRRSEAGGISGLLCRFAQLSARSSDYETRTTKRCCVSYYSDSGPIRSEDMSEDRKGKDRAKAHALEPPTKQATPDLAKPLRRCPTLRSG